MQTDLNQRERQRYAKTLTDLATYLTKVADELLNENDKEAIIAYAMYAVTSIGIKELGNIFLDSAKIDHEVRALDFDPGKGF